MIENVCPHGEYKKYNEVVKRCLLCGEVFITTWEKDK